MSKIAFTKFSGSGNDFIFIDNRSLEHRADEMIDFVQRVCRRGQSVGADGLMFIEPSERADFKWRFFNADGSEGEMCGNGGRCAARFARELGIAADSVSFETIAGVIDATMNGSRVKLRMTQPFDYRAGIRLDINGRGVEVDHLNTGVPHAVEFTERRGECRHRGRRPGHPHARRLCACGGERELRPGERGEFGNFKNL